MGTSGQGISSNDDDFVARRRTTLVKGQWMGAIEVAQQVGNLGPLIALLRSDAEMVPVARQWFAELLGRRRLVKKRGGQPTPMFRMSKEGYLAVAARTVRELRAGTAARFLERPRRMSRSLAIEKVAEMQGIEPQTLADYLDGRRGATRRRKRLVASRGATAARS